MLGLEVRRRYSELVTAGARSAIPQVLELAKRVRFVRGTVIDVGDAFGSFTRQCHEVFALTQYMLLEALLEYRPLLKEFIQSVSTAQHVTQLPPIVRGI